MADLNKVLLMGRLTRDPELRAISSGTSLTEFGMAINRSYKKESGEKVDDTCFIEITVWGNQADSCAKYLHKGSQAFIEGRLNFDSWDDKDSGKKRSKISVVADRVQFLDPKGSSEPYQDDNTVCKDDVKNIQNAVRKDVMELQDDIPF